MAYVCVHCGKKIKQLDNFIRCQYCGSRVIVKSRPNLSREVKTD
ncbi:MAG: DNA-directed RNA polymerase subunit P [Candidatus Marsarchaeota archaeon]|jgi:DNA-directed RNA polymerase subunit RPC12/RpoP|nr:DNA-directed RNA polymerase subunit P [Candidatus Marsarchaeota archaeon]MCL5111586.1 DNA-directed RNA polymerase subunit P [Candidatus Marsarchaeota archaeon]